MFLSKLKPTKKGCLGKRQPGNNLRKDVEKRREEYILN
jgi:hypothetical protein